MTNYVLATPELMSTAATDLAAIGSNIDAAYLAAAGPMTELIPAAADEVSTGVAALFSPNTLQWFGFGVLTAEDDPPTRQIQPKTPWEAVVFMAIMVLFICGILGGYLLALNWITTSYWWPL